MLQKTSITTRDGVFVNPVIGMKKSGDLFDEVSEESIAEVLSMWTGIPVFKLTEEETAKLLKRTQTRPLVTGLIKPRNALVFAVALEIIAFAVLWSGANLLSAILALSATMFYVFIYSLWLRRYAVRWRAWLAML